MDSPEADNHDHDSDDSDNRLKISATSSSSSPAVQDSPFSSFLRSLSPIKPVKNVQVISQTNCFHVSQPVFTSPRMDLKRPSSFSFIKRENDSGESGNFGQGEFKAYVHNQNSESANCYQKEDKSCSPSVCIDEYFADPVDMEATRNASGPPLHNNEMPKTTSTKADDHHQHLVPQVNNLESDQHQRGIRRHLQFEAKMVRSDTGDNADSSLCDSLAKFGSVVPLQVVPDGIYSGCQASGHLQNATFLSSSHPSRSVRLVQSFGHHLPACIPSGGLGLPLNRISGSLSMGSESSASMELARNLHDQEEKPPDRNSGSGMDLDRISIPSVAGETYAQAEDDQQESQATGTEIVSYEGRKLASANDDLIGESNQESPKRNRKKPKSIADGESCKRCNCKRSKCLKLYCDCFAAGLYCLDSCACEHCFNKPEYEDTVSGTRQEIEARNPLAFAPKVVKQATNSPANMVLEGNLTTPSSARHKRGCNCKKSKCLKKYCECYQAEVGCSTGCRCEGCNNSYGKKAASMYGRAEKWENPSHEKLDSLQSQDDSIKAGRSHNFTSTWKEFAGITPVSRRHSGLAATSGTFNIMDKSSVSEAQTHHGSYLQTSAPISLTPDSFLHDTMKADDTPQALDASTPKQPVQSGSPNQKRASPPQDHSQELRSSNSKGLRSGRKFVLPDMPSFPPLTPYSKLKDGVEEVDSE